MTKLKNTLITILLLIFMSVSGQSVKFVATPMEADIIMTEVTDSNDADIKVYETNLFEEYSKWDCCWDTYNTTDNYNFKIYFTTINYNSDSIIYGYTPFKVDGKVYFTDDKTKRGYKNYDSYIENILKRIP